MIVVIGANPTENHPVAATYFKQAVKRGAQLIVMDPRGTALMRVMRPIFCRSRPAATWRCSKPSCTIIGEDLYDRSTSQAQTMDFDTLAENVQAFSPEPMAPICGIPAATIRESRGCTRVEASIIFWGMGISQHVHGTDNARCLIALALSTGQIGKPGSGLHPLRGQNNVQGASDSGPDPDVLSRLPARRGRRGAAAVRDSCGAPSSIRIRA